MASIGLQGKLLLCEKEREGREEDTDEKLYQYRRLRAMGVRKSLGGKDKLTGPRRRMVLSWRMEDSKKEPKGPAERQYSTSGGCQDFSEKEQSRSNRNHGGGNGGLR